jgi:glutathione S-transferase
MIEIYYAPPSIYSRKVLAVLEEKDLDYEIKRLSFESGDLENEEYLKLNPNGEVPTLKDEDTVIYESTAIIEYLNDEYPSEPLLPEDSAGRALARLIEDYCDLHVYPVLVECYLKKEARHEDISEDDLSSLKEKMKRLDGYLGKKEFIAGAFSLADCAAMPIVATLEALEIFDVVSDRPALKAYFKRLKARPGYKGAKMLSLEPAAS